MSCPSINFACRRCVGWTGRRTGTADSSSWYWCCRSRRRKMPSCPGCLPIPSSSIAMGFAEVVAALLFCFAKMRQKRGRGGGSCRWISYKFLRRATVHPLFSLPTIKRPAIPFSTRPIIRQCSLSCVVVGFPQRVQQWQLIS